MPLWSKGYTVDEALQAFTVGDDPARDLRLAPFDMVASIAHAKGLRKAGVLSGAELAKLTRALNGLLREAAAGRFRIRREQEDCHTAIEEALVKRLGELGKKIHAGRSRNDQVQAALRLYLKDHLGRIRKGCLDTALALVRLARKHEFVPMPGYTHTRKAMPSSFGLWAGAYAELLLDDVVLLDAVLALADRSPLGSGAGYGVSLPLDRALVARAAGFAGVQDNVLAVQNTRGKLDAAALSACAQVMLDLNRLATDLVGMSSEAFGFVTLPVKFCTGSSLMPNKKNPDALELVRAKYHVVLGHEFAVKSLLGNLPAGYHRDLQLTKGALMDGLDLTEASLVIAAKVVEGIGVDKAACRRACSPELYATDEALALVKKGVPFRNAYRDVAGRIETLGAKDPVKSLKAKRSRGAPGNLGLAALARRIGKELTH